MTTNKTSQAVERIKNQVIDPRSLLTPLLRKDLGAIVERSRKMEEAASRLFHPSTFFIADACLYKRQTGCLGLNGVNGECINCEALRRLQEALTFDPLA
jgi:hypothetical protein